MKKDCEYAMDTYCKCDSSQYDIKNCSGKGTGHLYKFREKPISEEIVREDYRNCYLENVDRRDLDIQGLCCFRDLGKYCARQISEEFLKSNQGYVEYHKIQLRYGWMEFDCNVREYYNTDNCTDPVVINGIDGLSNLIFVLFLNSFMFII